MSVTIKPVSDSLLFSKSDAKDLRLGDVSKHAKLDQLPKQGWALIGYPDDEGIKLNGGRPGASLAPDQIRNYFYRMSLPEPAFQQTNPTIYDLGNLCFPGSALPERHQFAQETVTCLLQSGLHPVCLGGGHDYGFPDAAAFVEHNLKNGKSRPLVMNFDAHLDVRPTENGFNSGTPFYRLLEKYHQKIDFMEIGIQPQCNSSHHRRWAQDHNAVVIDHMSVERVGLLSAIQSSLETTASGIANTRRPLWLSIDIDGFCNSEAPGCSQSFATGLNIRDFLPALKFLINNYDVQGVGFYEVSPPLDQDDRTSKLAALILFHTLFSYLG